MRLDHSNIQIGANSTRKLDTHFRVENTNANILVNRSHACIQLHRKCVYSALDCSWAQSPCTKSQLKQTF